MYITLFSNVTTDSESNSLSEFITTLPAMQTYGDNAKVALTELSFTNSFYNIPEDESLIVVFKPESVTRVVENDIPHALTVPVSQGYYDNQNLLIDAINTAIKEAYSQAQMEELVRCSSTLSCADTTSKPPKFKFDDITRMVSAVDGYLEVTIVSTITGAEGPYKEKYIMEALLSQKLANMLGQAKFIAPDDDGADASGISRACSVIDHARVICKAGKQLYKVIKQESGKSVVDMTGSLHSILVYCDIIDYSLVGDTKSQLLRIVEIPKSDWGRQISYEVRDRQYLPLLSKTFSKITVSLRDDTGRLIPFRFGRTRLRLHVKDYEN